MPPRPRTRPSRNARISPTPERPGSRESPIPHGLGGMLTILPAHAPVELTPLDGATTQGENTMSTNDGRNENRMVTRLAAAILFGLGIATGYVISDPVEGATAVVAAEEDDLGDL